MKNKQTSLDQIAESISQGNYMEWSKLIFFHELEYDWTDEDRLYVLQKSAQVLAERYKEQFLNREIH